MSAGRRSDWLVFVALTGAAAYFAYAWAWNRSGSGTFTTDIYYYHYPNALRAAQAVRDQGRGFFWDAYQSCGQPFLGISSTGALYPPNALFLFFNPDLAFRLVTAVNLTVAGLSAYLLCRELGVQIMAALCGALAFAYGNASLNVTTWTPLASSPYAWLPAILLGCERILRAPSARRAVALAAVITVAILPGFPQVVFFAYQVMALRVLWELGSRRLAQPWATVATLALALSLPVLLGAVHLLPALEMARLSVRGTGLAAQELGIGLDWNRFMMDLTLRNPIGNPVILVPCLLASCSLINPATRRVALFYALCGLLYLGLAFGPNTPIFSLYAKLPLGNLFRMPIRFLWVTGLCLAILTAFGVEALAPRRGAVGSWWRRCMPIVLLVASVLALHWLYPRGFSTPEWVVASATVAAALVAMTVPAMGLAAGSAIAVALALNLLAFPLPAVGPLAMRPFPLSGLLPEGEALAAAAPAFAELRSRLTPNDRVYLIYLTPGLGRGPSLLGLGPKTAGVLGVPAIHDYEPQPAQRYAGYYTLMRTGRQMRRLGDYYLQFEGMMPKGFRRRLLDLAAARYLVAEPAADTTADVLVPPPVLLSDRHDLRVYENPQAFPRAFYVPRIEVVADPEQLLDRLANGDDDLRQVALVENAPPSGFAGEPGHGTGARVEFLRNEPEHVVLRVQAPARGFVHLADQYFPGWSATVNGVPAPITRANYLFRLVEVPAGESVVEFRYRPWSLRIGAVVSALTLVGVVIVLLRR